MQGCRIRRMPDTIEGSGEVSVLRVGLEDVSVRSSVGVGCCSRKNGRSDVVMTTFLCSLQDWKDQRRERPSEMKFVSGLGNSERASEGQAGTRSVCCKAGAADVDVLDGDDDESM